MRPDCQLKCPVIFGAAAHAACVGMVGALVVAPALTACSSSSSRLASFGLSSSSSSRIDPKTGTQPSPRVVRFGEPVPKGGGYYKIGEPYQISGRWYVPRDEPGYDRAGIASWYGVEFHGRRTANGEIFDMGALTAAHPTLPMPSLATVTNLANGRTILVRINDRGPYAHDRIIDLSHRSAVELGLDRTGTGRVRVVYQGPAPLSGRDDREHRFLAAQPWRRSPERDLAGADRWRDDFDDRPRQEPVSFGARPQAAWTDATWDADAYRSARSGPGWRGR
jgi:rare lipoprotein A